MKGAWILLSQLVLGVATVSAADWPHFRGPLGASVSKEAVKVDWESPQVIAWKAELPGHGPASPIVVRNRVFVTSATGVNFDRIHVLCFDAENGKQLWHRQFWATGRTHAHPSSGNAAPTPASDGERVFAFFSSNDLIALDLDGNLLWYRGLAFEHPKAGNDVGMSSSPIVVGNTVVVQVENQGDSFATGIDTVTGDTKWHVNRAKTPAWCSPIKYPGKTPAEDLVLIQSLDRLTAHDPETGAERWSHRATCDAISSAAPLDGKIFVPGNGLTAIDPQTESESPSVVWKEGKLNPGAASPIVTDDKLFIINRGGVLVCADPQSGKTLWRLRLEGTFWGTPTLAGNDLICCADNGLIQVVSVSEDGGVGKVAHKIELKETVQSSPAVVDGAVYVRSNSHLYKFN